MYLPVLFYSDNVSPSKVSKVQHPYPLFAPVVLFSLAHTCVKKIWQHQPTNFFLRIASESEKVFARILDEFLRCFYLPKISVFSGQTIQNFKTLTPPLMF